MSAHATMPSCCRSVAAQVVAAEPAASETVTEAAPARQGWWAKNPPHTHDVHGVQELVDALADAGDRLVVVDFYAPWCVACRGVHPKAGPRRDTTVRSLPAFLCLQGSSACVGCISAHIASLFCAFTLLLVIRSCLW